MTMTENNALTHACPLEGVDHNNKRVSLHDDFMVTPFTLVWWQPQVLPRSGCGSCGMKGVSEVVRHDYQTLTGLGCTVVGATYNTPEQTKQWREQASFGIPVITTTQSHAELWGVKKADDEPWKTQPRRKAFLVDDRGNVLRGWDIFDPESLLADVIDFISEMEGDEGSDIIKQPSLFRKLLRK